VPNVQGIRRDGGGERGARVVPNLVRGVVSYYWAVRKVVKQSQIPTDYSRPYHRFGHFLQLGWEWMVGEWSSRERGVYVVDEERPTVGHS
jgi:hypothetical protein